MNMKAILIGSILFLASISNANFSEEVDHYLNDIGFQTNVSHPTAYKAQMSGHYIGGSLIAKSQTRHTHLASIHLPHVSVGCGGIDLHMGAFSHIASEQFTDLSKAILTQAAPVALDIALSEISPNLKDIKDHMVQIMDTVNMANINSCEMAQGIVGAVVPKTQYASEHICKTLATQSGILSDYVSSRHGCQSGSRHYYQVLKDAKKNGLEDLISDQKNIAWYAMQKNAFYQNDPEMPLLLMSLTGTVIIDSTQSPAPIILPSLATNKNFIRALIHGGKIALYQCQDKNMRRHEQSCLHISKNNKTQFIPAKEAIAAKVRKRLQSLLRAAHDPTRILSESDKAFLESTHFPMYKFINVEAASSAKHAPSKIEEYVDIISVEILSQYLSEQATLIREAAARLKVDQDSFKAFDQGIDHAMKYLNDIKSSAYNKLIQLESMITHTQQLEQVLATKLGHQLMSHLHQE